MEKKGIIGIQNNEDTFVWLVNLGLARLLEELKKIKDKGKVLESLTNLEIKRLIQRS